MAGGVFPVDVSAVLWDLDKVRAAVIKTHAVDSDVSAGVDTAVSALLASLKTHMGATDFNAVLLALGYDPVA